VEIGFYSVWDGPIFSFLLCWPREGLRYGHVIGIHVSLGGSGDLRRAWNIWGIVIRSKVLKLRLERCSAHLRPSLPHFIMIMYILYSVHQNSIHV
jgi:hypothetical protein